VFLFTAGLSFAWDYDGHRMVNQIALASLPTNFPAFIRTPAAQERVTFLAGEPDRWRNTSDLTLKHCNGPDHYMDVDELALYKLAPATLSHFRYEFVGQLAVERALHPPNFPSIDESRNEDKTRTLVGLLPYSLTENYAKLKSGFSYLKAFEENGGTPEEISNAQQNILYVMGVMGHFAGDASQPLHTTMHHHGWVGANPKHYATNSSFHGWIDGGYIHKVGITFAELKPRVRPARVLSGTSPNASSPDMFPTAMAFIMEQHKLVEPLYQLNQTGSLSDKGEAGSKGRAFIDQQLLAGGQFLGDLWFSAWQSASPDSYLKSQLAKRKLDSPAPTTEKPDPSPLKK
ncbi:MAG: hypothetical protein ABJC04_14095, partial [Verrucomicrobiota bacterium]